MKTVKLNNRFNIGEEVIVKNSNEIVSIIEIRKNLISNNLKVVIAYRGNPDLLDTEATSKKESKYQKSIQESIQQACENIYKGNFYLTYDLVLNQYKNISFDKIEIEYLVKNSVGEKLLKEKDIRLKK